MVRATSTLAVLLQEKSQGKVTMWGRSRNVAWFGTSAKPGMSLGEQVPHDVQTPSPSTAKVCPSRILLLFDVLGLGNSDLPVWKSHECSQPCSIPPVARRQSGRSTSSASRASRRRTLLLCPCMALSYSPPRLLEGCDGFNAPCAHLGSRPCGRDDQSLRHERSRHMDLTCDPAEPVACALGVRPGVGPRLAASRPRAVQPAGHAAVAVRIARAHADSVIPCDPARADVAAAAEERPAGVAIRIPPSHDSSYADCAAEATCEPPAIGGSLKNQAADALGDFRELRSWFEVQQRHLVILNASETDRGPAE